MCRKPLGPLVLSFLLAGWLGVNSSAVAQNSPSPLPEPTVKVGDTAPDFSLRDTTGKQVKLSDFRGKDNVVLAFYVFAFTGG